MKTTTDIKRRFFDSLKRGTGEAFLIAKKNPSIDFSAYIIKGALKNFAYDGQIESSRAQYIFDLISLSEKKSKIRESILNGLAKEQNDTWNLTHLFDLAKLYAQQGDKEAHQAIYERFLNHPIDSSDWVGYEEILQLDGLQGLFYIAEKFGKVIEKNPDEWQDNWIISHFQNDYPKINVAKELKKMAKKNKYVRLYIDNIQRTEENWQRHKRKSQQFKDLIDEVINFKPFLTPRRTKELNETEVGKIAERLLVEKDLNKMEKLLRVFKYRKFPLGSEFILNLAKQKSNSNKKVKEFAFEALKFLKSDKIREFALDGILKTNKPEDFVEILISNFKKGDGIMLTEIAKKIKNIYIIESLAGSYVDIFNANNTKECKESLEVLYNKTISGIHRYSIIKVLINNNVLSNRLKKEIKYDSYMDTRELLNDQ